jgi:hypothetical protein
VKAENVSAFILLPSALDVRSASLTGFATLAGHYSGFVRPESLTYDRALGCMKLQTVLLLSAIFPLCVLPAAGKEPVGGGHLSRTRP